VNSENNPGDPTEKTLPERYKEVPWPESGRFVFGRWCLLGVWPAVFGVVETVEEKKRGEE
jgi:hypothetical protein